MCAVLHFYICIWRESNRIHTKEKPRKRASVFQLVNFSPLLYIHRVRYSHFLFSILRFKTKMLEENEVDSQGDMAGISIRDLEIILAKHGLPTSKSGTALNALSLNGFLDKARGVFNAKISKGTSFGNYSNMCHATSNIFFF